MQSKTWIGVLGFRALPRSHALGHRIASPAEGVCQSHPGSLQGHLLSPVECLMRAFYSLPTLWKVENHGSEAIGALECSGLTDEKANWPRTPTGPEPKLDWKGTSAVGRVWLLFGRPGRPGGRPSPPGQLVRVRHKGAAKAEAAFAQARLGPRLSQADHYPVASLASPATCKSISEIEKQPLGTVPRPPGQLPSWTNGCFHEILFDKSAFDQTCHSREISSVKSEDGAMEPRRVGSARQRLRKARAVSLDRTIKTVTILVIQMVLLKEVKILFLTTRCIRP